jgi:archaemetzincin
MIEDGAIVLAWIGEGPADMRLLQRVRRRIEVAIGLPTTVRTVTGPPADTLDPRREQRSSTKILRWILERAPRGPLRVVGVTDADLYIPVFTFAFGEAQLGGRAAVVSTARLAGTANRRPVPPGLLAGRLAKECLHELGHTFRLTHCAHAACVMSRCHSVAEIDKTRAGFCRDCRERLRNFLRERDQA